VRAAFEENLRDYRVAIPQAASVRQDRTLWPSTRTEQGATLPMVAALLRAGERELIAQEIEQRLPRIVRHRFYSFVDPEGGCHRLKRLIVSVHDRSLSLWQPRDAHA
jgi:hypothetical protein